MADPSIITSLFGRDSLGSSGLKLRTLDGERDMNMGRAVFVDITERDVEPGKFATQIAIYILPSRNSPAFELALQRSCARVFGPKPSEHLTNGRRLAKDMDAYANQRIGLVVGGHNSSRHHQHTAFDTYEVIIQHPLSQRYRAAAVKAPFMAAFAAELAGL